MAKKTDTVFGADGYSGSSVFIPTKFTTIASKAFESSKIIELSIPTSIKEIKSNAFKETTIERLMIQDLESWLTIKFGSQTSFESIISRVFIGCEEISSIDIPTTVEQLNPFVFNGWGSLQYINLPNTINTIGKRAFAFCKSLKMVIIPESVKEIQKETFRECDSLTAVVLPSELSKIELRAFWGGRGQSFTVISLNPCPPELEEAPAVDDDDNYNCCFDYTDRFVLYVPLGSANAYADATGWKRFKKIVELEPAALHDMINQLAAEQDAAMKEAADNSRGEASKVPFIDADLIKKFQYQGVNYIVTSKDTCRVVGNDSSVEDLVIPSTALDEDGVAYTVNEIGPSAFYNEGLHSITLPDTITHIWESAFRGSEGLTSVNIPSSVAEIGKYAFSQCECLTTLNISGSNTKIGERAFEDCSGLTTVAISGSNTKIGELTFCNCEGLTTVTISGADTSIGESAFEDCSSITTVTISGPNTKIGECAFSDCEDLKTLNISGSCTEIGKNAFSGCSGLTTVHIPNSVVKIGEYAFEDCSDCA